MLLTFQRLVISATSGRPESFQFPEKPLAWAARSTFFLVSGATAGFPLRTRETVATETPAIPASCCRVTFMISDPSELDSFPTVEPVSEECKRLLKKNEKLSYCFHKNISLDRKSVV